MSQILFNNTVDMKNILGTPSNGFAIAYDLDNVIKQKDSSGTITPLGGVAGSQSLYQTLKYGNDSVTYSIILGTSSYIGSAVGNGTLYLGYGNTYSVLMNVGLSSGTSSLSLKPDFISLNNINGSQYTKIELSTLTFSTKIGSSTYSTSIVNDNSSFQLNINQSSIGSGYTTPISIKNVSDGNDTRVKSSLHLNTYGSITSNGVYNSVIIGGQNLQATQSNTVYLGNSVNVNNKYTLPNVDGSANQVIKTDGSGNLSWTSFNAAIPPLNQVLFVGNTTGTYSLSMGSSQSIKSDNGNAAIYLDYNNTVNNILITNNISSTSSFIQLSDNNLLIGCTNGQVTTTNGLGLQYTSDYTPTFVSYSLVTKAYVDSKIVGGYSTYRTVYVDPSNGNNSTAQINRIDLPYLTIASASQVLYSNFPTGGGKIQLKKGLYNENCQLLNNVEYYCEPGVVFIGKGFNDAGGPVTANVYGYVKFTGTDATLVALDVSNTSNVNFEFDSIDNLQVAFKLNTSGTVNVRGRYIKSQSDFGSAISIEGSGNFNFNIKDGILGAYDVVYIKSGFSGNFSLTTKDITCDASINSNGPQVDKDHSLNVHETTTGTVVINSNLINNSVYAGGVNSAAKIGSGQVTVNGNLIGNNEVGLYITDGNSGNVTINGNISSKRESVKNVSNSVILKINNSLIKTDGLGSVTYSVHITGASNSGTYIYNSTVYNGLTNSSIVYMQGTTSQFGVYNSLGYSPGTTGYFIYGTPSFSVGIHNTRSNKDNYSAVIDKFSPSGFIYDQNLYLPKF